MRSRLITSVLVVLTLLLAVLNLVCGSVDIPAGQVFGILLGGQADKASWTYIVLESRLPQMCTAILCGASLSVAGLLLQTCFHNPLAGPSILGITNGASLGVALVMLACGGVLTIGYEGTQLTGFIAVVLAAFAGAMAVILLLLLLSRFISSNLMFLIVSILIGNLTSSVVSLCNFFANADNVHSYVMWGMGSFSDVNLSQLPLFAVLSIAGLIMAMLLSKRLNLLLLGDNYATNLGIDIRSTRRIILVATGILTAIATAFCGPVAFIGLAVPHIARLITGTSNHATLIPVTMLTGAVIALLCNLICVIPANTIIPLNAVTPIFGAPVILYVIFRKKA